MVRRGSTARVRQRGFAAPALRRAGSRGRRGWWRGYANVSATADQDTVVFLTSDAVWLATRGYADDITFADHPPAGKILADFVANGGRVWACGACTGPRGITADDLVDGAAIVTAANLAEVLVAGAATVAF
jgi:predicted peroxiredoxin